MHKQILLVAADTSDNCMGRVWILADMLARQQDVEIMGLELGGRLWPPLQGNSAHKVTALAPGRCPNLLGTLRLAAAIWRHPAQVVYVCKPRFANYVAGLLGARGRRLVLDIDDWEAGCARGGFTDSKLRNALAQVGISYTQLADWLIPLARHRTVCNVFFQRRYGGALVPHARDEAAFAPQQSARAQFGLPEGVRTVMFFGTPHHHKGVDAMISAVANCTDKNLHMVVAGMNPKAREYGEYVAAAQRLLPGRHSILHFIPWVDAPKLLACADILVVPQRETLFTRWGQTPAKVFDAMATAKPLVVSDIADIGQLVGEEAWLVKPDDEAAITAALNDICADMPAAQARAQRLRQRFLEKYSYAQVAPVLQRAVCGDA